VFPGNLQGRNIREVGPKGAVLVTVEDGQIVGPPRPLELDAVRWARAKVDVTGLESEGQLHSRLRERLTQTYDGAAAGRPLMVRVTISGQTLMHGDLAGRREALREEVRGIAVAISERLWIEKVQLHTAPVAVPNISDPTMRDELGSLMARSSVT